jgi:hypothetical protein
MTEDRIMIAEAVFNGLIGEEHLTTEEIDQFVLLVADAAMEKLMEEAQARGCSVFAGFEDDLIH